MPLEFPRLLEKDHEAISQVVRRLYISGVIPKERRQPSTGRMKENAQYALCEQYADFVGGYVALEGYYLMHDRQGHIFYLQSDKDMGRQLTAFESYLLLLLKLIYDEQMQTPSMDPQTTLREIREKGVDTGLIPQKETAKSWAEALSFLKKHEVITFKGNKGKISDDEVIYIEKAIAIMVSSEKVSRLLSYVEKAENEESEEPEEKGAEHGKEDA